MSTDSRQTVTLGLTRKSLEAVVIHACPHCEAPGVYKNDDRTYMQWPGCWSADRRGPVGDRCPNCGKRRSKDKNLGELTASMPRWLWNCILSLKWCVVKVIMLKRTIGERYGRSYLHRS
jgi:hypothetical protein